MINFIKSLLESSQNDNFELKNIDPREDSNNKETDDLLFSDAYKKASISIKTDYETYAKVNEETLAILSNDIPSNLSGKYPVEIHTFSLYPELNLQITKMLTWVLDTKIDPSKDSDEYVREFQEKINGLLPNINYTNEIPGTIIKSNISLNIIPVNVQKILRNVSLLNDDIYCFYNIISNKLLESKKCNELETYARIFNYVVKIGYRILSIYALAEEELVAVYRKSLAVNYENKSVMSESSEKNNEENVKQYIDEIDKLIDEIREFYDGFKYKELITPRKKKEYKMYEYVLGAVNRKYTLKIPIYKVEGKSDNVKDIIEKEFISKLESIVKKYPNFCILSPNWYGNRDMFIYITLREPFGDKEDRKDREDQVQNESSEIEIKDDKINAIKKQIEYNEKQQLANNASNKSNDDLKEENKKLKETLTKVQNEAALTTEEKSKLNDWEFGIQETREYPLNDEIRIRKAIQFFGYCKPEKKKELADSIMRRIIELDLVGKVCISEKHPNKKFFEDWMLEGKNPELKKHNNVYEIYVNGEKVDYGTLPDHTITESSYIIENEFGNLL